MLSQVHWLLKALSQDTPKNKEVEKFLGNCADAALSGKWVSAHTATQLSVEQVSTESEVYY